MGNRGGELNLECQTPMNSFANLKSICIWTPSLCQKCKAKLVHIFYFSQYKLCNQISLCQWTTHWSPFSGSSRRPLALAWFSGARRRLGGLFCVAAFPVTSQWLRCVAHTRHARRKTQLDTRNCSFKLCFPFLIWKFFRSIATTKYKRIKKTFNAY